MSAPGCEAGTVELAGSHALHPAVVGGEAVCGGGGAAVPGRDQPPQHRLQAHLPTLGMV